MLGPVMLDLAGTTLSALERDQLQHPAVGGVILFTRNYVTSEQLRALTASIRKVRSELLIAADTEGGRVQRFRKGFLRLPAVARYGDLYKTEPDAAVEACEAGGWLLAAELRAMDVDLAFTPVVDLDIGVSHIIGDRAFGCDADAVSALALAHLRGMRAAGMAATAKHFPGHGYVAPDSHAELPVDDREFAAIWEQDCAPYRALIAEHLVSVMVAHVRYAKVDELPASISSYWIQTVLRQRLGFAGAVFSDDLSMGGLSSYGDVVARMQAALRAGCDMVPVCNRPADTALLLERAGELEMLSSDNRLKQLRATTQPMDLALLQMSDEYNNKFNMLNSKIKVEVEV